jgi:DNA-binding XRE family transcriptional regulator
MQLRLDGTLVEQIRNERGLSREKLARLADCSTRTIVRIEREGANPGVSIVARVALALSVSIDDIFTEAEPEAVA